MSVKQLLESAEDPKTRRAYDRWASFYDAEPNPHILLEHDDVVGMVNARKGERILDAGCGTGKYTYEFYRRGARAIGIDFSKKMLQVAESKYPMIEFRVADIRRRLPFPNVSFDKINCAQTLKHLPNLTSTFQEFARVLKEGGELVVSVSHPNMDWTGYETRQPMAIDIKNETHEWDHAFSDYLAAAEEASLRTVETRQLPVSAKIRHMLTARSYREVKGRLEIVIFKFSKQSTYPKTSGLTMINISSTNRTKMLMRWSRQRSKQATKILNESGLLGALRKYGTVKVVGALAIGTVLDRDIDIIIKAGHPDSSRIFQLTKDLLTLGYFHSVVYYNRDLHPVNYFVSLQGAHHPGGHIWHLYTSRLGPLWKIDLTLVDRDSTFYDGSLDFLRSRLAGPKGKLSRSAILLLKDRFRDGRWYRPGINGMLINQAVLEEGITSPEEFEQFVERLIRSGELKVYQR